MGRSVVMYTLAMRNLIASLLLCFVLLTPTAVREYLSHSKSIAEWDLRVEQVKRENNGKLPDFWDREIIQSQYFDGLKKSWNSTLQKRDNER